MLWGTRKQTQMANKHIDATVAQLQHLLEQDYTRLEWRVLVGPVLATLYIRGVTEPCDRHPPPSAYTPSRPLGRSARYTSSWSRK